MTMATTTTMTRVLSWQSMKWNKRTCNYCDVTLRSPFFYFACVCVCQRIIIDGEKEKKNGREKRKPNKTPRRQLNLIIMFKVNGSRSFVTKHKSKWLPTTCNRQIHPPPLPRWRWQREREVLKSALRFNSACNDQIVVRVASSQFILTVL